MKNLLSLFAICAIAWLLYEHYELTQLHDVQTATITTLQKDLSEANERIAVLSRPPAPGQPRPMEQKNWLQQRIDQRVNPLDAGAYDQHQVTTAPVIYNSALGTPQVSQPQNQNRIYYYDSNGKYYLDQGGLRHYVTQ